jgi:phenylalanyl-tRNA synthetase beta chain
MRGDATLGFLGEIHPELVDRFAVPTTAFLFEFDLLPLLAGLAAPVRYRPLPILPAAKRDLSMLTPADLDEARVRAVLSAEPEVESVLLYDVYTGEQVGTGRRSLTYEISLRALDRTLTDAEIAVVVERMAQRLSELDVRLRAA